MVLGRAGETPVPVNALKGAVWQSPGATDCPREMAPPQAIPRLRHPLHRYDRGLTQLPVGGARLCAMVQKLEGEMLWADG